MERVIRLPVAGSDLHEGEGSPGASGNLCDDPLGIPRTQATPQGPRQMRLQPRRLCNSPPPGVLPALLECDGSASKSGHESTLRIASGTTAHTVFLIESCVLVAPGGRYCDGQTIRIPRHRLARIRSQPHSLSQYDGIGERDICTHRRFRWGFALRTGLRRFLLPESGRRKGACADPPQQPLLGDRRGLSRCCGRDRHVSRRSGGGSVSHADDGQLAGQLPGRR
jgi:hypothetical protein